ncbi:MAG: tRNA uridine-5-carboxymethylaminomethyl(34) synthesis GTPase MnmE [Cardiobacteriaceae bacterium]|nr:tRNA uridine-5-carboxymethylaminomethyl(34) synthesis GTPase MnmE [Cardiobacteriaceae bacterium]
MTEDTIAAIATPPGTGGVGVIRISGGKAQEIAQALAGKLPAPREATLARFRDGSNATLDQGLILYFPAPHSFTGEDVVELQGHGGVAVMQNLLHACFAAGARPAEPGEFSRRAFVNGKMDLAQAEAVADLIAARSQAAVQAANRSLQGEFSREVNTLADEIYHIRLYVEAALDFPEEEIDFLSEGAIEARLVAWGERLGHLLARTAQGRLLNDGIELAIIGKPNAGKSSLLNALLGEERAIVTDQAGTTRDIVREHLVIAGIPVHVLDTAGLRDSHDVVEQEGIRRARQAMHDADIILWLRDGTVADGRDTLDAPPGKPLLEVWNKADRVAALDGDERLWISAKTGAGLEQLKSTIARLAGQESHEEAPFIARARHVHALETAQAHYRDALAQIRGLRAGDLLAADLWQIHDALGSITGKVSADDLLGGIFASFCIGK